MNTQNVAARLFSTGLCSCQLGFDGKRAPVQSKRNTIEDIFIMNAAVDMMELIIAESSYRSSASTVRIKKIGVRDSRFGEDAVEITFNKSGLPIKRILRLPYTAGRFLRVELDDSENAEQLADMIHGLTLDEAKSFSRKRRVNSYPVEVLDEAALEISS